MCVYIISLVTETILFLWLLIIGFFLNDLLCDVSSYVLNNLLNREDIHHS